MGWGIIWSRWGVLIGSGPEAPAIRVGCWRIRAIRYSGPQRVATDTTDTHSNRWLSLLSAILSICLTSSNLNFACPPKKKRRKVVGDSWLVFVAAASLGCDQIAAAIAFISEQKLNRRQRSFCYICVRRNISLPSLCEPLMRSHQQGSNDRDARSHRSMDLSLPSLKFSVRQSTSWPDLSSTENLIHPSTARTTCNSLDGRKLPLLPWEIRLRIQRYRHRSSLKRMRKCWSFWQFTS